MQVTRAMDLVHQLHLPALLSDLDALVLINTSAAKDPVPVDPSGRAAAVMGSDGSRGRTMQQRQQRQQGGTRSTHRLPPRSACCHVMAKLILGEVETMI